MKLLDGDNVLYHYFNQYLVTEDSQESQNIMKKLLRSLAIWLPINLYQKLPVILPFVVRDSRCRIAVNKVTEEWGTSNKDGYFRDDNSLIKQIPRSLKIVGTNTTYDGGKLGKNFVASHIWRNPGSTMLASADPQLNSFIPNLVWLPRQISKLTDRENSFPQKYLQRLSYSIYHGVKLESEKREFVDGIWNKISVDSSISVDGDDVRRLNFFHITNDDIEKKIRRLLNNINLIKSPQKHKKLYCSRYLPSLEKIKRSKKLELEEVLEKYATIIRQSRAENTDQT